MKSFTAIPALVALMPTVLAAPSFLRRQDSATQDVNLQATSDVLGQACSNTLSNFHGLTISANLDQYGSGNITVGSQTYQVHENPDISGGITCYQIYNTKEAFMSCSVPIPASIPLTPLSGNSSSCFTDSTLTLHMVAKAISAGNAPPPTVPIRNNTTKSARSLHERAAGWKAEMAPLEWITGDFDVTEGWSYDNSHDCYANAGQAVCLWYGTAYTAYTVQNYEKGICDAEGSKGGDPYVMWSPNANNVGGAENYCVIGTCRLQGEGYWDKYGPAGGPQ